MRKKVIIYGIRHSGTTLLCTLTGAHSKVAMLNEPVPGQVDKIVGKPVYGMKLTYPHAKLKVISHLWLYRKMASTIKFLKKFGIKIDLCKGYPAGKEIMECDKLIIILRNDPEVIASTIKRTDLYRWQIKRNIYKFYQTAYEIGEKRGLLMVYYSDLLRNPDRQMRRVFEYLELPYEDVLDAADLNNTYRKKICTTS